MFSSNSCLLYRFLRLVTWSPYFHVALVFKGILPSEKGTNKEDLYHNKLRIFQASNYPNSIDVAGKKSNFTGTNIYHLEEYLRSQIENKTTIVVRRLICSNDEKRQHFEEAIIPTINGHLGDKYQLLNSFLGYYFHIPNIHQKKGWCCSTILAKVLMESGILKKDLEHVNCFSPGNFDQKSFKLNFEEGMSFGPELKLTGILQRKLTLWQMNYYKLKSGV